MEHRVIPCVYLGADSVITSAGLSTEENFAAISHGRSGCGMVTDETVSKTPLVAGRIDWERFDGKAALRGSKAGYAKCGEGIELEADISREKSSEQEGYMRLERLFISVIGDVVGASGVDPAGKDTLLVFSTTKGNIDRLGTELPLDDRVYIGNMAERVAGFFGAANPPLAISNACISGVSAIIIGTRLIEEGLYGNVIVAGGDLLTEFVVSGFRAFRSVSGGVCRPYDRSRDGLTLGEGCGAVLLTRDRGLAVEPVVEVMGGGISNDANHISGPSRTGGGLRLAIAQALEEGGITAGDIDFINGHGTATLYNDEMESKAFDMAGLCAKPLNSLKPWFGHTLGAAGVIETVISARELREGIVFGCPEMKETGTPHELNVSPVHRNMPLNYCLKTASGFGGCNAALVLGKGTHRTKYGREPINIKVSGSSSVTPFDAALPATSVMSSDMPASAASVPVSVSALAPTHPSPSALTPASAAMPVPSPAIPSAISTAPTAQAVPTTLVPTTHSAAFPSPIAPAPVTAPAASATQPATPPAFGEFIRERFRALGSPDMKFYKMDDLSKLGYVAAGELLRNSGLHDRYRPEDIAIILANRSASLDSDMAHQRILDASGGVDASPAVFVYTLPNVAAGEICIRYKIEGENTFFIQNSGNAEFPEKYAAILLERGLFKAVVCGRCEFLAGDYMAELRLFEIQR